MIDFKEFRKANKLTQDDAAEYFGCNQSFISQIEKGIRPIPDEFISKILANPSLDSSMLKKEATETQEPIVNNNDYLLVPLYNFDARGGFRGNEVCDTTPYIEKHIPFPAARKEDICVHVSGDSMLPVYPPGSIILLREVEGWQEYFGFGNNFMLLLNDGRRIVKRVQKSMEDPKKNVLCVSYNPTVDSEELPKSMIFKVFKVIRTLTDEGF